MMASDSESSGTFQMRALYFEETDDEFDLSLPPVSGADYLRRVQLEARQCPDVMVAEIDQSHFAAKQTVKYSAGTGCSPAPEGYAPSNEWQRMQIANFSELRMKMSRFKSSVKAGSVTVPTVLLPDIRDEEGWCRFCLDDTFQKTLAAKNVNDSSIDQSRSTSTSPAAAKIGVKRKNDVLDSAGVQPFGSIVAETSQPLVEQVLDFAGVQPFVSVVVGMSQPLVEQVLDYHISWFQTMGFSVQQGQWFFAFLTCLEKPLTPEACSSIRTLARQCANLRASLKKDDPFLSHLNLLICLVSGYFDQRDLADT